MKEHSRKPVRTIREIYRIGHGPSSSHTMAPRRAAELFIERQDKERLSRIVVTLYGSLAATGKGHLTDITIKEAFEGSVSEFVWLPKEKMPRHPNSLKLESYDSSDTLLDSWVVYSTGGGELMDDNGEIVGARENIVYPFNTMAELLELSDSRGKPLWGIVDEMENSLWDWLTEIWKMMKTSVQNGLDAEGSLPGHLNVPRKASTFLTRAKQLQGALGEQGQISAYALAVSEENAAGGEIVTAPTCGGAGSLPGLLYYLHLQPDVSEKKILRALATAGIVGALIKANASISGAEVGCQGETGSGSSMAAAAAAQILGGSPHQVEYAAEIAMEHSLGLTCDPVDGLVQIPCIERNATGAVRALNCAGYSLLSDGRHHISFDEVIETMYKTGIDMAEAYRETSTGGLALLGQGCNSSPEAIV